MKLSSWLLCKDVIFLYINKQCPVKRGNESKVLKLSHFNSWVSSPAYSKGPSLSQILNGERPFHLTSPYSSTQSRGASTLRALSCFHFSIKCQQISTREERPTNSLKNSEGQGQEREKENGNSSSVLILTPTTAHKSTDDFVSSSFASWRML